MNPAVIIVLVIIVIAVINGNSKSEMDVAKDSVPSPSEDQPETTDVVPSLPQPDKSHVPPPQPMSTSRVELYSKKDFEGDMYLLRPGMKIEFARMNGDKTLTWTYQSMKITSGTFLMFKASVSGSNDRGFAVGKYDVPDMFEFIKAYDNIYNQQGIFMDSNYWARPFYMKHLTPQDWNDERQKKHEDCINTTLAWDRSDKARDTPNLRYNTEEKRLAYCEYAAPESNDANITGFKSGFTNQGYSAQNPELLSGFTNSMSSMNF
jgi:hypothetical protein